MYFRCVSKLLVIAGLALTGAVSPSQAAEAPAALKTALSTASQGAVLSLSGLNANFLLELFRRT